MQYAQLNTDNSFKEFKINALTVWDDSNYCTPEALIKDNKAAQFKIVEVAETSPPPFSVTTHSAILDGAELIDGMWKQKWAIAELSAAQAAANLLSARAVLHSSIIKEIQARLDSFAKTKNYDNILSACTYAFSNNPAFAVEGQAAINARDQTWTAVYVILDQIKTGVRPAPMSFSDIEPDLPELTWTPVI